MKMMLVVSTIPTRKSDSLPAHKHLLHSLSNTSPLDCRFHLLVQCVSVPYSLYALYSLCTLSLLFSIPRQVRRHIVHTLVDGGGQHVGFDALDYLKIRQGNAGKLGTYAILSVLPDKIARFLLEFHAHRFESLDLPFLPADRSDFDVHGALLDDKVHEYVIL